MAFPSYPTIPDPWPDRAQGQAAFDTSVSATFTFLGALESWASDWASEASQLEAALVASNLPSLTGRAGYVLGVNDAEDGAAFLAGKSALTSFRNKIINGQFSIDQRGSAGSGYSSTGFTLDRWRLENGSGAANTISRVLASPGQTNVPSAPTYFLDWARETAGSAASKLEQRIESVRTLAGDLVTVTFWARADAATTLGFETVQNFGSGGSASVYTNRGAKSLTTSWQKFTFTFSLNGISGKTIGAGDCLIVRFRRNHDAANPTTDVRIANVSMVAGNADLEDDPGDWRPPEHELALCQRYYWRGLPVGAFGFGSYANNATASMPVMWPVTMRDVPSLASDLTGATTNNLSVSSFSSATQTGARLVLQGSGAALNANINFSASDYFEADAEL